MNTTLQTNTFLKGMNCDIDVSVLGADQYRYAENVRIVTNDGGSTGVLQNIEGVKKYTSFISPSEIIIGHTTISKFAIIFTKVVENNIYKYNKVYRVEGFDTPTPVNNLILKGDIGLCAITDQNRLSVVGNYETDDNIKVYFTDGITAVKSLNVIDGKYTGIGPANPLLDSNGHILNPLALDITPGAQLPPFKVVELQQGNLASGVIQYCYQLFNIHGSETTLSSISNIIQLTDSVTTQESTTYKGQAPNKSSGKSCILRTDLISKDFQKCRIISISYSANNQQPRIFIVDEIDLLPSQNTIEYRDTGNNIIGELTVEQFNALTGYQFIAATIEKMDNRLFAANIQEDSWNPQYDARAYRSNINGLLVLNAADTSKIITKQLPTDSTQLRNFYESIPENHDCINPFNTLKSNDFSTENSFEYSNITSSGIKLKGGSGLNVDYTFVTAGTYLNGSDGSVNRNKGFKLAGMTKITSQSNQEDVGMNISPEFMDGTYLQNPQTNYVEKTIPFINRRKALPNYADPILTTLYTGYQRDEVYRFGIVFYNRKNVPSPVHWIADIRIPHASEQAYAPFYPSTSYLNAIPVGIKFSVRNLPQDCLSFEIVRCDRTEADRSIIVQGAVSVVGNHTVGDDKGGLGGDLDTRPPMWLSYSKSDIKATAINTVLNKGNAKLPSSNIRSNYVMFTSPEVSIMGEDIIKQFKDVTYLDSLYGLASPYGDVQGASGTLSRIMMSASKIKSTNEDEGEISLSSANLGDIGYVDPGTNAVYIGGHLLETTNYFIPAMVSKYYVPFAVSEIRIDSQTGDQVYINIGKKVSDIQDVKFPRMIPYNSLDDKSSYYTTVGEISYLNLGQTNFEVKATEPDSSASKYGMFGPCLVLQSNNITSNIRTYNIVKDTYGDIMWGKTDLDRRNDYVHNAILCANIKKYVNPYGGNTFSSRQNSIYIAIGSYRHITDSSTDTYVFGGDVFLNILDQPVVTIFQKKDPNEWNKHKMMSAAYIPFESSINLALQYGDSIHRSWRKSDNFLDIYMQIEPAQLGKYHTQDAPYFAYNSTYSTQPGSKKFIPASIYTENDVRTANRIVCSEAKTGNEILDNWTKFKFANYLDVDNQWGQITNLKAFKSKLFFWQDQALGIASVNERSLIQDNNIGSLTLGTGGILTRADYMTNSNGSSIINDNSITNSDGTIYWYDFDKNEICSVDSNMQILSKEKGVQTYLNEMYTKKRDNTYAFYDKKYNEVWFKFYNKTLIFSEQIGQFTSFYTFDPEVALTFSDKTVLMKDNKYYALNSIDIDGLDSTSKISKVVFAVNQDGSATKTFDNVYFSGEFNDPSVSSELESVNNILLKQDIKFKTKSQQAIQMSPSIDYREDTYRLAIGREIDTNPSNQSYAGRMKGKYLICEYTFDCNDNRTFKLPYINTTYRYSLV